MPEDSNATAADPAPVIFEDQYHVDYPDEPLPRLDYSLDDFVEAGSEFVEAFVRERANSDSKRLHLQQLLSFALAGRKYVDGRQHRVYIDALRDLDPLLPQDVTISRDYDSIIGHSTDLPYVKPIAIYPLPNLTRDTLVDDNHLKHTIKKSNGETISVPYCKIPNIGFATVNSRNIIRLFFPSRYEEGTPDSPTLDSHTLSSIYLNGIRPAVLKYQNERGSYWHPSVENLHNASRGRHGHFHYSTIDVPAHVLPELGPEILERLKNDCALPDAFYLHEYRGTKGRAPHDPSDPDQIREGLDAVLADFEEDVVRRPNFYIDVATEFTADKSVLNWKQDAHPHILAHVLNTSASDARALTSVSSRFLVDPSSHLDDVAGFRYRPTQDIEQRTGIAYIQAYCTDKNATYQRHAGGHFRRHYPSELVPKSSAILLNDTPKIYSTFSECAALESTAAARLEVRVRIDLALDILVDVWPDDLLNNAVVRFHAPSWWFFKFIRSFCLHHGISRLCKHDLAVRAELPSLTLGGMLIWMLNAVLSRPNSQPTYRMLADACSLRISITSDTGDLSWRHTTVGRGLYFLSAIICQEHEIRVPNNRVNEIDPYAIANVYMAKSLPLIQQQFYVAGVLLDKNTTLAYRVHNKTTRTQDVALLYGDEDYVGPDFGLDALGIQIPSRRIRRSGPDVAEFTREDEEPDLTADQCIGKIWRQFFFDLMRKAPNRKRRSDGSHVIEDESRAGMWSEDDFKTLDVRNVFYVAHTRRLSPEKWRSLQFDRYFPKNPQPTVPGQMQNLPYMSYYVMWKEKVMDRLSNSSVKDAIRAAVEREFNKLKWVPHSESDRVWTTKARNKAGWKHFPGKCAHHTGVSLAINPHTTRDDYIVQVGIKRDTNEVQGPTEEEVEGYLLFTLKSLSLGSARASCPA